MNSQGERILRGIGILYSMTNIKGDMSNLIKNSVNFISGQLIFCVESGGHIQNSPETFHFVPFGMPIERFWQQNCYFIFYLVTMETHIHIIFIKNGHNLENMILRS